VLKILAILAAVLIGLAFVVRAVVSRSLLLPGGWPPGSHWYQAGWVMFWIFLIAGLALGAVAMVKFVLRGQGI
jgi:hypothetical protein